MAFITNVMDMQAPDIQILIHKREGIQNLSKSEKFCIGTPFARWKEEEASNS